MRKKKVLKKGKERKEKDVMESKRKIGMFGDMEIGKEIKKEIIESFKMNGKNKESRIVKEGDEVEKSGIEWKIREDDRSDIKEIKVKDKIIDGDKEKEENRKMIELENGVFKKIKRNNDSIRNKKWN